MSIEPTARSPRKLLILEDDPMIMQIVVTLVSRISNLETIQAVTCLEARDALQKHADIAVILSDHLLPDGTGLELLQHARAQHPSVVRLMMTGAHHEDHDLAIRAINTGEIFRFIPKPFTGDEIIGAVMQGLDFFQVKSENARLQARLAEQNEELREMNHKLLGHPVGGGIELAMEILRQLDPAQHKHAQRVSRLALALGREMHLADDHLRKLELAAYLHDLGLLGFSRELAAAQRSPDQVTDAEQTQLLESHVQISAKYAAFCPEPEVAEMILLHHEYLDGSGYPMSKAGEQIPLLASILSVADCYDELDLDQDFLLSHFEVQAGTLFAPEVVRALIRLCSDHPSEFAREKAVLVDELLPGMSLSSPVYTTAGMLLFKQGQVLTEHFISILQRHNQTNTVSQTIFVERTNP